MERDPKVDPRPGDELAGPLVKAKVTTVTIAEGGAVLSVSYLMAVVGESYSMSQEDKKSIQAWRRFVGTDRTAVIKRGHDLYQRTESQ